MKKTVSGRAVMKRIIPVFILMLCFGFISQCDWLDNDDESSYSNICWPEILAIELIDNEGSYYYFADVTFFTWNLNLDQIDSDCCDSHINQYRVSYFSFDGEESAPPAFNNYTDIYIPGGENVSHIFQLYSVEQFEDVERPFIGFAIIQFWGKFADDSDMYCEVAIDINVE